MGNGSIVGGQRIDVLSGGGQQRVQLALAQLWSGQALGGGDWLLLDEPTTHLDLAHQAAVDPHCPPGGGNRG